MNDLSAPMTKRRLEQYRFLVQEIALLERQISGAAEEVLADHVRGSLSEFPYTERSILIEGVGARFLPRLENRKALLVAECRCVEEFIESVEDSTMRLLLTLRYIQGETLEESAEAMRYSKKQLSRLLKNFFEKMSLNVPKCP